MTNQQKVLLKHFMFGFIGVAASFVATVTIANVSTADAAITTAIVTFLLHAVDNWIMEKDPTVTPPVA